MNSSLTCLPMADDVFGPQVHTCRQDFDFTLLFEQSVLSMGPSILLLLLCTGRVSQLYSQTIKTRATPLYAYKLAFICIQGCLQVALLVLWSVHTAQRTRASIPAAVFSVLVALSFVALSTLEHKRSIRPSLLINAYLLVSTVLDLAQMRTLWLQHESVAIAGTFIASVTCRIILLLFESHEKRSFLLEPYRTYSPEALGGILNTSIFWWMNDLILRGYRSVLRVGDLFSTDVALSSLVLDQNFQETWTYQKNRQYPLLRTIITCFKGPLLAVIIPRVCLIGFKFSQPLLINRAISLIEAPESPENTKVGYALIAATFLIYVGSGVTTAQYKHKVYRAITMIRGGLICLIYNSTLKLDNCDVGESAAVTLMSTDIDRINNGFVSMDSLWAGPIEAGVAIILLEQQLGAACIAPVFVALACTLGAFAVGKWAKNTQKEWVEAVQKRVAITASVLNSIRGIKMQGLSNCLSDNLESLRREELLYAKPFRKNIITTAAVSNVTALCGPAITFIVYIIIHRSTSGGSLNVSQAFTSLSLISLLSTPISEMVQAIPTFAAAIGCMERIQSYVKKEERQDSRVMSNAQVNWSGADMEQQINPISNLHNVELQRLSSVNPSRRSFAPQESLVMIKNASFKFSPEGPIVLQDIDIEIKHGTLTMVVGGVGSGKSSLLKALLGELSSSKGFTYSNVTEVAYCAQDTWLPNSSLRQIILGISNYDEAWYHTVLSSCALDHDAAMLPDSDHTVIGSMGASLSGGQKQRLALARAIYARKDLILLDDVLSGLDAKTEQIVFQRVLGPEGLCAKHHFTVVFATHAVQHLRFADNIVVLDDHGTMVQQGSFSELQSNDVSINNFITKEPTEYFISPVASRPCALKFQNTANTTPASREAPDLARQTGDLSVYLYFARSMGWLNLVLFLATVILYAFASEFQAVLLQWWSEAETSNPGLGTDTYMGLYAMLAALALIGIVSLLCVVLLVAGPKASIELHNILLASVMAAPYSWFVSTDTGITLNRFSQDLSLIDMELLVGLIDTSAGTFMAIGEVILIVLGARFVAVIIPFIIGILYILQMVYLRTSRQLRFLDLESKSPLYSHFLETLSSLTTIRAFCWEDASKQRNHALVDASQRPFYLLYCVQRWLNLVLDLIVAGIAVLLITFATQMRGTTSAGSLGVALVNILQFNTTLSFLIRKWTELETSIGAVARVKAFESSTISENADIEVEPSPANWPSEGLIEFDNVTSVYSATTEPVLQNLSFRIEAGQKIGIVGRTGSGKSSLLLTIFHMLEITTGTLKIDGISLSTLRRHDLRAALVTVLQEPFLVPGTVRFNADPFLSTSSVDIENALRRVGLWDVFSTPGSLDAPMDAAPLSQGQKQLFCVARALLRKVGLGNRDRGILVLDEISSHVDLATEKLMMDIVETEFRGWTVLAVAHRLSTLIDYDRVIVLDGGRIIEEGGPAELIGMEGGMFSELWRQQNL